MPAANLAASPSLPGWSDVCACDRPGGEILAAKLACSNSNANVVILLDSIKTSMLLTV